MFLSNKYNTWYFNIIDQAKIKNYSKATDLYLERHHIIPKSFGGKDTKDNLVYLSAREHFIVHALLTKFTTGKNKAKMLHSFMLMKGKNNYQSRYINSFIYDKIKTEYSKIRSEKLKGGMLSEEHKSKISVSLKRRNYSPSKETRDIIAMKAKTRKRKPWSQEYKENMSRIMKSKISPD